MTRQQKHTVLPGDSAVVAGYGIDEIGHCRECTIFGISICRDGSDAVVEIAGGIIFYWKRLPVVPSTVLD